MALSVTNTFVDGNIAYSSQINQNFTDVLNILSGTVGIVSFSQVTANPFISSTSNPATAGTVRLANLDSILWRNAANGANLGLQLTAGNNLQSDAPIIFTTTTNGVVGTVNADNALAGVVGEYFESKNSSKTTFTVTTSTWADLTTMQVTAGDWDVVWSVDWNLNGATMGSEEIGVSVNPGSGGTGLNQGDNLFTSAYPPTSTENFSMHVPLYRVNVSTATTLYGKGLASYSAGNPGYRYKLAARRVR